MSSPNRNAKRFKSGKLKSSNSEQRLEPKSYSGSEDFELNSASSSEEYSEPSSSRGRARKKRAGIYLFVFFYSSFFI